MIFSPYLNQEALWGLVLIHSDNEKYDNVALCQPTAIYFLSIKKSIIQQPGPKF
jgi:hypothetical protein